LATLKNKQEQINLPCIFMFLILYYQWRCESEVLRAHPRDDKNIRGATVDAEWICYMLGEQINAILKWKLIQEKYMK
jgi:hypothetical protein